MGTGSVGGVYFPTGCTITELINWFTSDTAYVFSSKGSGDNVNKVDSGEYNLAIAQNDVSGDAYKGVGSYKDKEASNIRGVASLYPELIQIATRRSSEIKSIEDLRGKKISIGPEGSGTAVNAELILKTAGIWNQIGKIEYFSFDKHAEEMIKENLDAAFFTAGTPAPIVENLAKRSDISLLSLNDSLISKLQDKNPYFVSVKIPAGTYKGMDRDARTVGVAAILITNVGVPEDKLYELVKLIFSHLDYIRYGTPIGGSITLPGALDGIPIPLHPGAKKYFEEVGLL